MLGCVFVVWWLCGCWVLLCVWLFCFVCLWICILCGVLWIWCCVWMSWFGIVLVCVVVMVCLGELYWLNRMVCCVLCVVFCLVVWICVFVCCGLLYCCFSFVFIVCRWCLCSCWCVCSGCCGWFVVWGLFCVWCCWGSWWWCFSLCVFLLDDWVLICGVWIGMVVCRLGLWLCWSWDVVWFVLLLVWVRVDCWWVFVLICVVWCWVCCWICCICWWCLWERFCWICCVLVFLWDWFSSWDWCNVWSGCVDVFIVCGWCVWCSLCWMCWVGFFCGLLLLCCFCYYVIVYSELNVLLSVWCIVGECW